jgi:hypothetical protein
MPYKRFGKKLLALLFLLTLADASRPQSKPKFREPWRESPFSVSKGTRAPLPISVRRELSKGLEDCPDLREAMRMDAYRTRVGAAYLLSVHARNSCFCGATGNCEFWLYRAHQGRYRKVQQFEMVRDFGFLTERHHGLPDLVIWSHDSATRTPGALWRFDGRQYTAICAWQLVWEQTLPNGETETTKEPHVEDNTCPRLLGPEAELF